MNKGLILLILAMTVVGCGKSSTIKTHIQANQLGDGKHLALNIVVPLSEKSISSFTSPVAGINPLLRGFVGSIMNIGASMGAGKTRLSMTQPIPEIPDAYIGSLKIKRIFFFLETLPAKRKFYQLKPKEENFDFLRRLAVKLSASNMDRDNNSWEPKVETGSLDSKELNAFQSLFKSKRDAKADEWDKNSDGLLMIRYNQDNQEESLQGEKVGAMNIIQTETPNATRKYLEEHYSQYLKRIHTLSKSILVELKKDPVAEEMFKMRLSADAQKVAELGIGEINPCDNNVCLDLKVPDVDLIPILKAGNAIKVDAYIDPKEAPKSFQLKGFIEFEVKIKTKI